MKIAIIIALEKESTILKKDLSLIAKKTLQKDNTEIWTYENHQIIINECGVGKVNSAINTHQLLNNYQIDYILNIGSCGAINKKIKIGDIFIINNIFTFDVNLTAFNYVYGQLPKLPAFFKTQYQSLQSFAKENHLFFNSIASGDSFINSSKQIRDIHRKLKQDITLVDMESSAIAQVAFLKKVPLFILKSVSDNVYLKEKNQQQWQKEIDNVAFKLSQITLKLLKFIFSKGIKKYE